MTMCASLLTLPTEQSLGMFDYMADTMGKPEVKKIAFKRKLHLHKVTRSRQTFIKE